MKFLALQATVLLMVLGELIHKQKTISVHLKLHNKTDINVILSGVKLYSE
jgi:hypothetical protein